MAGMDKKDKRVQKAFGVTDEAVAAIFAKSGTLTQEELDLLRVNARDNVLARYIDKLKNIQNLMPVKWRQIMTQYIRISPTIQNLQDIIDYHYDYFNYYDCIKTQKDLEFEIERAKKIFFEGNIELNIKIEFDFQYYQESDLFKKPTFYSYYNHGYVDMNGDRYHHIAIPSTQKYLTDDEVMVVMKHEWGHIRQGHCRVTGKQFESQYNNQAQDISINSGMTEDEKALLFSAIRKITKEPTACPCMDLISPTGQGGFGLDSYITPTAWVRAVNVIKAYYAQKEEEGGGGGGSGGPTQPGGSGSGGSGDSDQPPVSSTIEVGDYVYIPGSKPEIYGKVLDIDANGKATYEEYSPEEWAEIKKQFE